MRSFLPLLLLLAIPLRADDVVVSAAASTREAMTEVAKVYEARTHDRVLLNFGGSNEMARQILAGAKVDVFVAADVATMTRVHATGTPLLSNRLAIVTAKPIGNLFALKRFRRIAIANWRAGVPAGVYAASYFSAIKEWDELEPRLVPMVDVRAALAAFDAGSVDAAIVYRTDARLAKRKHATLEIDDEDLIGAIVYPAANLRPRAASNRFFAFLFSADARRIFDRYGFLTPKPTKR
ncbi:MAG: molybdate transport system substrate-binding protein [Acidobacteriota bacterium]|jgi:molybdate transport system substrate-binding protein|nr:molybdate transport system substrate-binding protein [Acidobacteriota bacterium]